jgi:divalent metal cation (Fe/Co/Zn/Cd) transporter
VEKLVHPELAPPTMLVWSYGVLGISLVLESLSFRVAWGEFRKAARGRSIRKVIFETRDPTIPLVLAEDTTAIIGLLVALISVGLMNVTGLAIFDAIGSILIGVLLAAVALVIARITHRLLIGESASAEEQARALVLTEATTGVVGVTQLLTMHLGPDVVILAMKVAFRPGLDALGIEDVTNRIEARVRAELPQMRKIFIEVDSRGDGRGLQSLRAVAEGMREAEQREAE